MKKKFIGEQSIWGRSLARLERWKTNRLGNSLWETEQGDVHRRRSPRAGIARKPLLPRQPPMSTLGARKESLCGLLLQMIRRVYMDIYTLTAQKLHPGASMLSARPISPDERQGSWFERGERMGSGFGWKETCERTHPAWPVGAGPVSLACLPQRTGSAMSNPGRIHEAQGPIPFWTPFLKVEGMSRRTAQGPVRLQGELASRQAPHARGGDHLRGAIARKAWLRGSRPLRLSGLCFGKLGEAQRVSLKLMPQRTARRFHIHCERICHPSCP